MRIHFDRPNKLDFVNYFMSAYFSPGIGIRDYKSAYNTPFEITELRNSYKICVEGVTKRFNNLLFAAEFIFDKTFKGYDNSKPVDATRHKVF